MQYKVHRKTMEVERVHLFNRELPKLAKNLL